MLVATHRLDVHEQQGPSRLAAAVGQRRDAVPGEVEALSNQCIKLGREGGPGRVLGQRNDVEEGCLLRRDQVTDLVEEVAIVVPAEDQRVQVDNPVPQLLRVGGDAWPERLERVKRRTVLGSLAGDPVRDGVEQQLDPCGAAGRGTGGEGPDLR